ncbi:site-specific recombinase XerD [Prescottella equi NBRC 101255 = C 7]|nr:site-specific recombinase XerD [Prescottella equi NBRC 101255 = C 7]
MRYQVRYRTPDRKQTKKRGFKTKRDAEAFASTVEVEKMTGSYIQPSLGRITVAELAPVWLDRKKADVAPSNYRTLESAWGIHVDPQWGRARLQDIETAQVERWIAQMQHDGSGQTTVIRAYGVLAGILDDAVKSRRLASNPARGVENLPRKTSERHVYLSAEDAARVADESGPHRPLVLTHAYTGIRWGEAVALRVRDVEFLRRRLSCPRQCRAARRGPCSWSDQESAYTVGIRPQVTLDTYANLFDGDLDAVAMVLDAQFSPRSVPKMCPPAR